MIAGFFLSAVYVLLMFYIFGGRLSELSTMELNAVGDFLAGAFSPLAFFWLILGYRQQGKELRFNGYALHQQVSELKKTFDLQLESSRKQDALLDPLLSLSYFGREFLDGVAFDRFIISNNGHSCRNIQVELSHHEQGAKGGFLISELPEGGGNACDWDGLIPESSVCRAVVTYNRINGSKGSVVFDFGRIGRNRPAVFDLPKLPL